MDFEKERKRILKLKRPLSLQELAILSGKDPATLDFSMCERCKPYGECSGFRDLSDEEWEAINKLVDEEKNALLRHKKNELKSCSSNSTRSELLNAQLDDEPTSDINGISKFSSSFINMCEDVFFGNDDSLCGKCRHNGECLNVTELSEEQLQLRKIFADSEAIQSLVNTFGLALPFKKHAELTVIS